MSEDFKETIIEMSKEFDEKNGYVTCEVAIHKDKVDEFESFVNENTQINLGKWIAMECETCVEYNGEGYLHVSIETYDTIAKIEQSSNHVRTFAGDNKK